MARKKKRDVRINENADIYDEGKGGVILKDGNTEGLLALVKVSEAVNVKQDHDANINFIGFNGKLKVENPSTVDRLWDIDVSLKNIEGTDLEEEKIRIQELGITEEDNVESREFKISGDIQNLLLVKEYINTLPDADNILNNNDIETDLLKLKEKVSDIEVETIDEIDEPEIEEEVEEPEIEEEIEEPEIEEEVEEPEIEEEVEEPEIEEEEEEPEIEEEVEEPEIEEEAEELIDYESYTVSELKEYCEEKGIKIPPRAKKAEIIELIREAEENKEEYDAAAEYTLESYGIAINKVNTVSFAIALHSLFENPITEIKVTKEVPTEFRNIKVLNTSIGTAEVKDNQIIWTIDELDPELTSILKISAVITVDTKESVKTGPIEITYKATSSFTGGLDIEKFDAFTNNRHYIDMIERDEDPGVWDCKLVFENPSEFKIEVIDIDVHAADEPDTNFIALEEEYSPSLPAGAQWHSASWQYESEDYPSFRKQIDFRVLSELQAEVLGTIAIEEIELTLASITGDLLYEEPEIVEVPEELREENVILLPSYKESEVKSTMKVINDGSSPLNEVKFTQKGFTENFKPPEPEEIEVLWDGDKVELTPEEVKITPDSVQIVLENLKERPTEMFEPESVIEVKYPIHSENPPRDLEFSPDVVYNANTYPIGQELEYIPEEKIPIFKVYHIRRKYRVGKEIIPIGDMGNYQIKLHYENMGEMALKNFVLIDKVPDNFEYSDFSSEPKITDEVGTDTLEWAIEILEKGDVLEISYNIKGSGEYHPSDAQLAF
ncbi:MAG: hypothetical protein ACFFAN_11240 [Promethearchaeota archaeon]